MHTADNDNDTVKTRPGDPPKNKIETWKTHKNKRRRQWGQEGSFNAQTFTMDFASGKITTEERDTTARDATRTRPREQKRGRGDVNRVVFPEKAGVLLLKYFAEVRHRGSSIPAEAWRPRLC